MPSQDQKTDPLDFIVTEEFIVNHVLSESKTIWIRVDSVPRNDWDTTIVDGKPFDDIYGDLNLTQHIRAGKDNAYILTVKSTNDDCKIKTLSFVGPNLNVIGDMTIKAKIFSGKDSPEYLNMQLEPEYFHLKRERENEAIALEIAIMKDGHALATARSDHYKLFYDDSLFPM